LDFPLLRPPREASTMEDDNKRHDNSSRVSNPNEFAELDVGSLEVHLSPKNASFAPKVGGEFDLPPPPPSIGPPSEADEIHQRLFAVFNSKTRDATNNNIEDAAESTRPGRAEICDIRQAPISVNAANGSLERQQIGGSHPPDPVSAEETTVFPPIPWNIPAQPSTQRPSDLAISGQPTQQSCISHPLEFTEIDLSPTAAIETVSHVAAAAAPAATEGAGADPNSDIPADAPAVVWDLPPPAFNGPSPDAAPPTYDEALTCTSERPPLPRHPFDRELDYDVEENRRLSEMRLELELVKANRKKMYVNFMLGVIFFIVILVICRFTLFPSSSYDNSKPVITTTTLTPDQPTTTVPTSGI
ncbi:hypothetical protein PFISCL1PPCAC_27949, partial [Pristionchus fissidentatus]